VTGGGNQKQKKIQARGLN